VSSPYAQQRLAEPARRRRLRVTGVNGFLAAVAGAAIVAVVSWGLSLLLRDPKPTRPARP